MGGGRGSKYRSKIDVGLSEGQKACIWQMFDVRGKEYVPPITNSMLQHIWKDTFSDGLRIAILNYFFKTTKQRTIEDMEMLYYGLVEASVQERANSLILILGIDDSIPPKSFQTYVSDLIESYMLILQKKHPESFSTWITADLTEKSDRITVAKYFTSDINYKDGKIDHHELESWLNRCGFVAGIFESVMKHAFNMEVRQMIPILPLANKVSSLLRVPTALAVSYLTQFHADCKEWRLLYSSSTDAHSWNYFEKCITWQGPTLVLIQDTAGPLFGGYASHSWKVGPTFYGDEQSFLFRLRPQMVVCRPTGYNHNYQYMNRGSTTLPNGLGMGGQINYFGFFLTSEFGPGSVSKTCTTFQNYLPLASQNEFSFSRLEVWGLGDPESIEERTHDPDLVMHRDPQAHAILEMMGKTGHSKNIGPDNV